MTTLILASASPARLSTLRAAGVQPRVVVSGVDESTVTDPEPSRLAARLARLKARAVAALLPVPALDAEYVVGCDSVLELDGVARGKPGTAEQARELWGAMRGRSGVLHTGHCLVEVSSGRELVRSAETVVHFADLTDADVEAYVASGEPLQVAGGFTIDGLGGAFVRRVEGDPHNVVGISLPLLREMLAELGVTWTDLWRPPMSRGGLTPQAGRDSGR